MSRKKFSIKSPYKKDNNSYFSRTLSRQTKSPYSNVLKHSMSYKTIKTESN